MNQNKQIAVWMFFTVTVLLQSCGFNVNSVNETETETTRLRTTRSSTSGGISVTNVTAGVEYFIEREDSGNNGHYKVLAKLINVLGLENVAGYDPSLPITLQIPLGNFPREFFRGSSDRIRISNSKMFVRNVDDIKTHHGPYSDYFGTFHRQAAFPSRQVITLKGGSAKRVQTGHQTQAANSGTGTQTGGRDTNSGSSRDPSPILPSPRAVTISGTYIGGPTYPGNYSTNYRAVRILYLRDFSMNRDNGIPLQVANSSYAEVRLVQSENESVDAFFARYSFVHGDMIRVWGTYQENPDALHPRVENVGLITFLIKQPNRICGNNCPDSPVQFLSVAYGTVLLNQGSLVRFRGSLKYFDDSTSGSCRVVERQTEMDLYVDPRTEVLGFRGVPFSFFSDVPAHSLEGRMWAFHLGRYDVNANTVRLNPSIGPAPFIAPFSPLNIQATEYNYCERFNQ